MTAPRVSVRKYFLNKRVLPFPDLGGKSVEFKFAGRPNHQDIAGKGAFDLIQGEKPDFVRLEIVVRRQGVDRIRIPISRTMLASIKEASSEAHVDFSLIFRYRSRREK
jgi:hypothetical protein